MSESVSEETWWDAERREPRLPDLLAREASGGPGERFRAFRARHAMREERAESTFAASRNPERGLPIAPNKAVWEFLRDLIRPRKAQAIGVILLNAAAAAVGLIVPRVLGGIVDQVNTGGMDALQHTVIMVTLLVVAQALLLYGARLASAFLGQGTLAEARESVVRSVLRLPLGRVESASTGDLVTRVTRDVSRMAETVRWALPELIIAATMCLLTLVAALINSPLLTIPTILSFLVLWLGSRSYLRHAPKGYVTEGATYSTINTTITETIEGARSVEALGLGSARRDLSDGDLAESAQAERYTLTLRNFLFMSTDLAFYGPMVLILLLGGLGYSQGLVSLGQITTAILYTGQLVGPMDRLIQTIDTAQVGFAATTRLIGIAEVPTDRHPTGAVAADDHLRAEGLCFAYREGHDVLHDLDLDLVPGERLAIVGPSGSGKSTLARLIAGINRPRTGKVTVGGVDVMDLPLETLRTEVALVTQEHHVFVGTVRDNIVLARDRELTGEAADAEVRRALEAVDALDWVDRLPDGLDTQVGSGNYPLTPAQAQQVALARLVVADPHTLVLDEATSLIDPRTARHLEGSLHALMTGRTVVAIAHRLHTAHDADRIAVVIDGRIAEIGSHDELLALDGEYASLWRAWSQ